MKLFRIFMQQQHSIVVVKNDYNPSLHYTEIDRCQDNIRIDNDDDDVNYRQILHSNACLNYQRRRRPISTTTTFESQIRLFIFVLLLLTAQSNALPIIQQPPPQSQVNYNQPVSSSYLQTPSSSIPVAMVQLIDRPAPAASSSIYLPQSTMNTYKVYRRLPIPPSQQLNRIPSYSNGAPVQIYDQTNFGNQQVPSSSFNIVQKPNEQQFTVQLRRERQRRHMVDRMIVSFDENGDGQLTKEELYTMALRVNIFPKFHTYLKQQLTTT